MKPAADPPRTADRLPLAKPGSAVRSGWRNGAPCLLSAPAKQWARRCARSRRGEPKNSRDDVSLDRISASSGGDGNFGKPRLHAIDPSAALQGAGEP